MTEQENDKHKAPAGDEPKKADWPWRTKTQEYRLLAYTERVCDLPRRGRGRAAAERGNDEQ